MIPIDKPFEEQTIVEKLRNRAKIRRAIGRRPENKTDRIADLCEEAANHIEALEAKLEQQNSNDVWAALSSEIPDIEIARMLADEACGFLEYEDHNPDVGMGMSYKTALFHAERDVLHAATIWGRKIFISDDVRATATDLLAKLRGK